MDINGALAYFRHGGFTHLPAKDLLILQNNIQANLQERLFQISIFGCTHYCYLDPGKLLRQYLIDVIERHIKSGNYTGAVSPKDFLESWLSKENGLPDILKGHFEFNRRGIKQPAPTYPDVMISIDELNSVPTEKCYFVRPWNSIKVVDTIKKGN